MQVLAHLDKLKHFSFGQFISFPEEKSEKLEIEGKSITLTTYKLDLENSDILLVVQAFIPTLWFPTYFAANGIGKIFVEGMVIADDGTFRKASDSELWIFK